MNTRRGQPEPNGFPWVNPIGGSGDMLMVAGVMKQAVERDPTTRYNVVRRTNYQAFFRGHPAVETIGFPPKGSPLQHVTYWHMERPGPADARPFQILARAFGLETPVEERLFFPGGLVDDPVLVERLPWKSKNVVIAPSSDSRRKTTSPDVWEVLVDRLLADDVAVFQVGRGSELNIRGAYSLLGLTTPAQLISFLARCDAVVAPDNFIMHASHLVGTPAVVIWGPTHHEVYGYADQIHLQQAKTCDLAPDDECIGPKHNEGGTLYNSPCPVDVHCMDAVTPEAMYKGVQAALRRKRKPATPARVTT